MFNTYEKRKKEFKRNMISSGDSAEVIERKEREHKKRIRRKRWIIIAIVVAAIIAAVACFMWFRYHRYTNSELKWEKELPEGSFAGYEHFGENVIKYSHDGASCIDANAKDVWVDTYEMSMPKIYVSGEYACVYDAQGSQIRIYNSGGVIGNITTIQPVTKAVVAENGVCAAILEDNDASYITFFKKDGTDLDITIKSRLDGDGYPIDIALSPEGTQLISSFAYLDGGVLHSKVVFYDFSEIGKNVPNRLVGGFEEPFADSLIARVRFLNSVYSYAVADTGLYIFSSKNISSPELIKTIETGERIESIASLKNHLAVIYTDLVEETITKDEEGNETVTHTPAENSSSYRLVVYKNDGSILFEKIFSSQFDTMTADDSYIYIIGNENLMIINMQGITKYSDYIEDPARMITHAAAPGAYIFAGTNYMREYQFK